MAKDTPAASAATMRVVVVTPEATLIDDAADFVALPLFDGEIGIAPLHGPMIGRLGFGEMRITRGDAEQRFYVDGGFVQVVDNVVSVLTNRAAPSATLDVAASEEQLRSALTLRSNTDELLAIRDRSIGQARAQLRTARRAK